MMYHSMKVNVKICRWQHVLEANFGLCDGIFNTSDWIVQKMCMGMENVDLQTLCIHHASIMHWKHVRSRTDN